MLEITFTVEKQAYFHKESYKKVIAQFQNKFLGASVPNKSTIKHISDNFSNNYTLEQKKKPERRRN